MPDAGKLALRLVLEGSNDELGCRTLPCGHDEKEEGADKHARHAGDDDNDPKPGGAAGVAEGPDMDGGVAVEERLMLGIVGDGQRAGSGVLVFDHRHGLQCGEEADE